MLSLFRRLMMSAQGAVVIEYTLIVSLIAVRRSPRCVRLVAKSPTWLAHEQRDQRIASFVVKTVSWGGSSKGPPIPLRLCVAYQM